jgi:hypothetical protein
MVDNILVGSPFPNCASINEAIVNIADPTQISVIVLRPATLFFFSLSYPTIAPQMVATKILGSEYNKISISCEWLIISVIVIVVKFNIQIYGKVVILRKIIA